MTLQDLAALATILSCVIYIAVERRKLGAFIRAIAPGIKRALLLLLQLLCIDVVLPLVILLGDRSSRLPVGVFLAGLVIGLCLSSIFLWAQTRRWRVAISLLPVHGLLALVLLAGFALVWQRPNGTDEPPVTEYIENWAGAALEAGSLEEVDRIIYEHIPAASPDRALVIAHRDSLKADRVAVLSTLRREHDPVSGETRYYARGVDPVVRAKAPVILYIEGGGADFGPLMLRLQYDGEELNNVVGWSLLADTSRFHVRPPWGGSKSERHGDVHVLWYEFEIDRDLQPMIEAMANARRVVLRHEDENSHVDVTLSNATLARFRSLYTAYGRAHGSFRF